MPKGQFSEIDLTLNAELPKGFSIGYIEYVYPTGDPSTREGYAAWSHEFSFVTPTVTLYYDVAEIDSGFLGSARARARPGRRRPPSS